MSSLAVVIPALLRSEEDQRLLENTIRKVPWRTSDELVLVTQGQRAPRGIQALVPRIRHTHFERPLAKWRAIDCARAQVAHKFEMIALLDADDPVSEESLHDALRIADVGGFDLLIGQRTQIALRALDELSSRSRLYLEIFSNVLLLLRLDGLIRAGESCPDIQSGFYVVGRDSFEALQLDYIGDYGGELALYYQLAKANRRIVQVSIQARASTTSSYKLERIVNDIFDLPFFKDVDQTQIDTATLLAPKMYRSYLNQLDEANFHREIVGILSCRRW